MAIYGWNTVQAAVVIADGGTASTPFSVPKGAVALTVHTPALTSAATLKIQGLTPASDQAAETWQDVSVFDLTDGTFEALDGIPSSADTTLPITATGGGVLRFVASGAQTGAKTIPVDFHMR